MINLTKLSAVAAAALLGATSASAAVTISWDFNGVDNGWTVENGVSAFLGDGIEAADADGTRSHDAANPNFILRSPIVNFATADGANPIIDIDWNGGAGLQTDAAVHANPAAVIGYNDGISNPGGAKGLGFLNLTSGNYDYISYDPSDGANEVVIDSSYSQADLIGLGVSTTDNYQLDFFDTDDGGWGWTRLNHVGIDENAVGAVPEPSSFLLFGLGGLALLFRRRSR